MRIAVYGEKYWAVIQLQYLTGVHDSHANPFQTGIEVAMTEYQEAGNHIRQL